MAYMFAHNLEMDIQKVIADNLDRWMSDSQTLDTLERVADASGVGYGTIRRMRKCEGNPTVKNVNAIAKAFKRKATDLMTPAPTLYALPGATVLRAEEVKADEYQVLHGYRVAGPETRDLMHHLAERAIDAFEPRREQQ